MLIINKTLSIINYNNLLIDIEVSRSQIIRDNLRRFIRDYLNKKLSLLKIDY